MNVTLPCALLTNASGITIDEAVHNLSTANFSNRGQQLKHETA